MIHTLLQINNKIKSKNINWLLQNVKNTRNSGRQRDGTKSRDSGNKLSQQNDLNILKKSIRHIQEIGNYT